MQLAAQPIAPTVAAIRADQRFLVGPHSTAHKIARVPRVGSDGGHTGADEIRDLEALENQILGCDWKDGLGWRVEWSGEIAVVKKSYAHSCILDQ
jgi:hypothetical protein